MGVHVSDTGLYRAPVFKVEESYPPQIISSVPVQISEQLKRAVGAPFVVICAHVSVMGLYRPPVLSALAPSHPPQRSISDPVHTASQISSRGLGAPLVDTGVHA